MSQSNDLRIVQVAKVDSRLREIWVYYGRKVKFSMRMDDWKNYADLVEMLQKTDPTIVQAWPNKDVVDENGQSAMTDVEIRPLGLKLLSQQPRQVHRQATIDGEKVDLRSERALMILTPPIQNLELVAGIWLRQLESEADPRVLKAVRMSLMRLLAWRGTELSLELKDKICNMRVVCT